MNERERIVEQIEMVQRGAAAAGRGLLASERRRVDRLRAQLDALDAGAGLDNLRAMARAWDCRGLDVLGLAHDEMETQ
jgi:hypothetical protein